MSLLLETPAASVSNHELRTPRSRPTVCGWLQLASSPVPRRGWRCVRWMSRWARMAMANLPLTDIFIHGGEGGVCNASRGLIILMLTGNNRA